MGECLAVLFSLSALPACEQSETRTLAGELDYVLENKGVFDRKREERIDAETITMLASKSNGTNASRMQGTESIGSARGTSASSFTACVFL